MRSITLKRQQSTVKTKLPCHHWKHNMFLLFFFSNLHKTLGAVRFLLICSYFVPLSWSQTCFVLFCQHNNTSEIFNNIKWTDRSPNVQLKFWNCDSLSENQYSPNLSLLHRWWITFTLLCLHSERTGDMCNIFFKIL